jgi:hypothetical protein
MSDKHQLEQYLALAKEAEHHAATGVDRYAREQWLRIANSYREIAQGMVVGTADAGAAEDVQEEPSNLPATQAPLQATPDAARRQSMWQRITAFLRRGAR